MTSLDQNTPLSAETLVKIRRNDERDLRHAAPPYGSLDETAWERHVLLAEVDRLSKHLSQVREEPAKIAPTVFMVDTEENVGATLVRMIDQDGREAHVGLDDNMRRLLVSMLDRDGSQS